METCFPPYRFRFGAGGRERKIENYSKLNKHVRPVQETSAKKWQLSSLNNKRREALGCAAKPATANRAGRACRDRSPKQQQAARAPPRKRRTSTIGSRETVSRDPFRLQVPGHHAIHLPTEVRTTAEEGLAISRENQEGKTEETKGGTRTNTTDKQNPNKRRNTYTRQLTRPQVQVLPHSSPSCTKQLAARSAGTLYIHMGYTDEECFPTFVLNSKEFER